VLDKLKSHWNEFKEEGVTYDAEFYIVNPSDFELEITTHTRNRYFKMILQKSLGLTKRFGLKEKQHVPLSELNEIEINKLYYKLLNSNLNSIMNQEKKNALEHDVKIVTYQVSDARFKRDKKNRQIWNIHILVKGQYCEGLK
jgi:hypothetical protein